MRSTAIPFISLGCIVALQAQTPSPALIGARPGRDDSFSRRIIDDSRPFRELTPEIASKPAHLFSATR